MAREYVERIVVPQKGMPEPSFIFFDGFEGGQQWARSGSGSDFVAEFITQAAHSGELGAHLRTKATTPASGDLVALTRSFALERTRIIDMSFVLFPFNTLAAQTYEIEIRAPLLPSLNEALAEILINISTGDISIRNSAGGVTSVGTVTGFPTGAWNTIRFSFDRVSGRYISVIINDEVFDLSAELVRDTGGTNGRKRVGITIRTGAAQRSEDYVDEIFIRGLTA